MGYYKSIGSSEKLVCSLFLTLQLRRKCDILNKIVNYTKLTKTTVRRMLVLNGLLKAKPKIIITEELTNKVINLYLNSNLTEEEIGKEFGFTEWYVQKIIKNNKIPLRDAVISNKRIKRRIEINENYFEKILKDSQAWALGFICGDGNIVAKDNFYKLKIGLNEIDIEILEKIKILMNANQKIKKFDVVRDGKTFKGVSLLIARKKISRDLINLGVGPNKSHELKFPNLIKEVIPGFIRGMLDSDGGFFITRDNELKFHICCPVPGFLEELQEILIKECDLNKTIINFSTNCFVMSYVGNDQVRKIFNYLYSDTNVVKLNRKYNYAKKHFENLDFGIKSRNLNSPALCQYHFGNDNYHPKNYPNCIKCLKFENRIFSLNNKVNKNKIRKKQKMRSDRIKFEEE